MVNKFRSIIYVNFPPYENTGRILDYILDNFEYVFLFSFNHQKLDKKQIPSKLQIYHHKKMIRQYYLRQILTPQSLLFLFLPFRSLLMLFYLFFYTLLIRLRYGTIDRYFTVNAFTAWAGIILQKFRLVGQTVFWVWDYYPPYHENLIVRLMRRVYWEFDKVSAKSSRVVFLNKRLLKLRQDIHILPLHKDYPIVPIGTFPIRNPHKPHQYKIRLGFMGVVKRSQGMDLLFDSAEQLKKRFPNISLEIIGSGPDDKYFKSRAKKAQLTTIFHGAIVMLDKQAETAKINHIMSHWDIGVAPYIPDPSNVSFYGDPSKIKQYLSFGIPVITTNVFEFSDQIQKHQAGCIIKYDSQALVDAVAEIIHHYVQYKDNAEKLAKHYEYTMLYRTIFVDAEPKTD